MGLYKIDTKHLTYSCICQAQVRWAQKNHLNRTDNFFYCQDRKLYQDRCCVWFIVALDPGLPGTKGTPYLSRYMLIESFY